MERRLKFAEAVYDSRACDRAGGGCRNRCKRRKQKWHSLRAAIRNLITLNFY